MRCDAGHERTHLVSQQVQGNERQRIGVEGRGSGRNHIGAQWNGDQHRRQDLERPGNQPRHQPDRHAQRHGSAVHVPQARMTQPRGEETQIAVLRDDFRAWQVLLEYFFQFGVSRCGCQTLVIRDSDSGA